MKPWLGMAAWLERYEVSLEFGRRGIETVFQKGTKNKGREWQ